MEKVRRVGGVRRGVVRGEDEGGEGEEGVVRVGCWCVLTS